MAMTRPYCPSSDSGAVAWVHPGQIMARCYQGVFQVRDLVHKSRSASPGSHPNALTTHVGDRDENGATTEDMADIRGKSDAGRRDAPPANCVASL